MRYNGGWLSQSSWSKDSSERNPFRRVDCGQQKYVLGEYPWVVGNDQNRIKPWNHQPESQPKKGSLVGPLTEYSKTYAVGMHVWICLPLGALRKKRPSFHMFLQIYFGHAWPRSRINVSKVSRNSSSFGCLGSAVCSLVAGKNISQTGHEPGPLKGPLFRAPEMIHNRCQEDRNCPKSNQDSNQVKNCPCSRSDVQPQPQLTVDEIYWMLKPSQTIQVGGFNPSEKYESQLGWLFPVYGKIKFMFQTTNQNTIPNSQNHPKTIILVSVRPSDTAQGGAPNFCREAEWAAALRPWPRMVTCVTIVAGGKKHRGGHSEHLSLLWII